VSITEGELICERIDRGKGDEVRLLVHTAEACGPEDWKDIKFLIFDCPPLSPSSVEHFEQRIEKATKRIESIKQELASNPSAVQLHNVDIVESQKCTGFDHLYEVLSRVLEKVTQGWYW
jgi:hypothetical protein